MLESVAAAPDSETPRRVNKPNNNERQTAIQHAGTGDWYEWPFGFDTVLAAAQDWRAQLKGINKPWLCWNISPVWSVIQQKLVTLVGWTPVVGYDPRVGPPPLVPGAVPIDFNKHFGLEEMRMHVPIEFAFLFTERLAFWHSDLLCRKPVMRRLSRMFEALPDGKMAAVREKQGVKRLLNTRQHRYWEVVGCMTKGASLDQYIHGTGWWRNFSGHPSCPDN